MSKRILIVDDSTTMRKIIARALTEAGHRIVGEAANGNEAVRLYDELRPDLVTMDITMRGMDGFATAEAILSDDSQAKILFFSNLDVDKYRDKAASVGALGIVRKQKIKEILETIERS